MLLGLALREDLLEGERNPARPVSFDNGASSPRAGRRGAYFSMVMSSPETESWRCVVRVPSPMAPECVPLLVGESDATRTGRQKRVGAPAARAYSSSPTRSPLKLWGASIHPVLAISADAADRCR